MITLHLYYLMVSCFKMCVGIGTYSAATDVINCSIQVKVMMMYRNISMKVSVRGMLVLMMCVYCVLHAHLDSCMHFYEI